MNVDGLGLEPVSNPNDPGTWSTGRQRLVWGLAFSLIAALAWSVWLSDEVTAWTAEQERELTLKSEHQQAVQRVKGLQALEARKRQLEEELARLEKQLPAATEMDGLLRGITAAGRVRGLQFELFKPAPVQLKDGYAEIPVSVRVVGGYHDLGAFMGDLARLPRIVTLHNMVLVPQSQLIQADRSMATGSRLLVLEATLRTYRALDAQEELQVRKRAERAAAAPGAPQATGAAR